MKMALCIIASDFMCSWFISRSKVVGVIYSCSSLHALMVALNLTVIRC